MRAARLGIWTLITVVVVLATRTIVYALAPQSVLLAALAHNQVGPDVTVPVTAGALVAASASAAVLWLAVVGVRERLALEGGPLVRAPRLEPWQLAMRVVSLFLVSSFAFAMLESTIHWREGLGWHGLRCLTGPVHRDAIPILAALSLLAVAIHGAIEHLLAWARRLVAQLAAQLCAGRERPSTPPVFRPSSGLREGNACARGPPLAGYVS